MDSICWFRCAWKVTDQGLLGMHVICTSGELCFWLFLLDPPLVLQHTQVTGAERRGSCSSQDFLEGCVGFKPEGEKRDRFREEKMGSKGRSRDNGRGTVRKRWRIGEAGTG